MNLLDVNWLAVVLAALAGFVVGGIWYGPLMGKSWMAAVGKTEDDLKNVNPAKTYGFTFYLYTLIKLLCYLHCSRCTKTQLT